MSELSRSARKVADALEAGGLTAHVEELPGSTRSAKDAAAALHCEVAQIAKSLVFRELDTDGGVLIVASGADRVDEEKISRLLGGKIERPRGDWVRERTGFAIGGVPPLGHDEPIRTIIDCGLLGQEIIWAAAGTPRAVFETTPDALRRATGAEVADVTEG